jgi:hypothetical protein
MIRRAKAELLVKILLKCTKLVLSEIAPLPEARPLVPTWFVLKARDPWLPTSIKVVAASALLAALIVIVVETGSRAGRRARPAAARCGPVLAEAMHMLARLRGTQDALFGPLEKNGARKIAFHIDEHVPPAQAPSEISGQPQD